MNVHVSRGAADESDFSDEVREYSRYHEPRFAFVLRLVSRCLDALHATPDRPARYLDIGPHILTRLVGEREGQRIQISTLGWENRRLYPSTAIEEHFQFDLNDSAERDRWPRAAPFDLILAAEVIEHVYTAPEHVFTFMRGLVRPGGYVIVQTPNAAALRNRLLLLAGRNPFERIRSDRSNPGHYREYTRAELVSIARNAGFHVEECVAADYFRSNRVLKAAGALLPGGRRGLTIVLRNPA